MIDALIWLEPILLRKAGYLPRVFGSDMQGAVLLAGLEAMSGVLEFSFVGRVRLEFHRLLFGLVNRIIYFVTLAVASSTSMLTGVWFDLGIPNVPTAF